MDLQVGQLDGGDHPVDVVPVPAVDLEGPGQLLLVLGLPKEPHDGLDRHPAGHLARGVSPHAVGDDGQALALREVVRVLVVVALHPDVGLAGKTNAHPVERERGAHRWKGHAIAPPADDQRLPLI
jgi:hypothetical protein